MNRAGDPTIRLKRYFLSPSKESRKEIFLGGFRGVQYFNDEVYIGPINSPCIWDWPDGGSSLKINYAHIENLHK